MKCDFFAIGDTTVDAFISLCDVKIQCDGEGERCVMCMRWGDKIVFNDVTVIPAVGNSANASVCAARLGLTSGIATFVGNDQSGGECIAQFKKEGVITKYITQEEGKATNYHFVLSYEAERTILIKHENYSYDTVRKPDQVSWVYLSSFGEHAHTYQEKIATWLQQSPETQMAFQPGTHQIQLGYERLQNIYRATDLFFCNKQEAQSILQTTEKDSKVLLQEIRNRGPKIPVITDGPKGAYALHDNNYYFVPAYPDKVPPRERTGAGDAFSSTLTAYIAKGLPFADALLRAPINSMSVVQHIGAQKGLLTDKQLEQYLDEAPEDYRITTL